MKIRKLSIKTHSRLKHKRFSAERLNRTRGLGIKLCLFSGYCSNLTKTGEAVEIFQRKKEELIQKSTYVPLQGRIQGGFPGFPETPP